MSTLKKHIKLALKENLVDIFMHTTGKIALQVNGKTIPERLHDGFLSNSVKEVISKIPTKTKVNLDKATHPDAKYLQIIMDGYLNSFLPKMQKLKQSTQAQNAIEQMVQAVESTYNSPEKTFPK